MSSIEVLQKQLEEVQADIASGAAEAGYADKRWKARTLNEMKRIEMDLIRRIGGARASMRITPVHSKGV